ncbi:MAG: prepilin-type N-terminal cleavage/methylation domain-containing protein [Planctomycetota bacterium]|nr:prepilin-type N-terminal cleavage/methylation domain-containing protein [Planctomycetota bacterium]MDI6787980.1 prepilin-type N-terminal cleavage/methylation domain-containing protein [Planctomycetota bacterium]
MNAPDSNNGFTLIELLVVLSIIAVIAGIGLGVVSHSGRQFAFQAVRGEIVSLIRYARTNAITEKSMSTVVIDPQKKEIYSYSPRTAGLWHFEDNNGGFSTGAFGNNAALLGDVAILYGRIGNGLMMAGAAAGYAQCGSVSVISENQGIIIECWISPSMVSTMSQRDIIRLDDGAISIEPDDSIKFTYGSLNAQTSPSSISYQQWSNVVMTFEPDYTLPDGSGTLSLKLNNILLAEEKGIPAIMPGRRNLTASSAGSPFTGMVDEVRASLMAEIGRLKLEPDIILSDDTGQPLPQAIVIQFDKKGNLRTPVSKVMFTSSSTRDSFTLEVTSSGTVRIY